MIEIVQGVGVGAGKSYYATSEVVLPHLARGGTVYASSSYQLNWDGAKAYVARKYGVHIQEVQWNVVKQEDIYKLHELTPPGTDDCPLLLVIDEAQQGLNTRDTRDNQKRALFDWFCQSRHDNNDLLFLTQHVDNIDVQVRRLATHIIRIRNMATFKVAGVGMPMWLVKLGYGFRVVRMDPSQKIVEETKFLPHDGKIFGAYISKACQGTHKRVGHAVARLQLEKVNKTKNPRMKFYLILIMCGLFGGGYMAYQSIKKATKPVESPNLRPGAPGQGLPVAPGAAPLVKKEENRFCEVYKTYSSFAVRSADGSQYFEETKLVTDRGTYIVGELSRHGMVLGMRRPSGSGKLVVVKCNDEGRTVYVVADTEGMAEKAELPRDPAVPPGSVAAK
jgi:hypothetical protein